MRPAVPENLKILLMLTVIFHQDMLRCFQDRKQLTVSRSMMTFPASAIKCTAAQNGRSLRLGRAPISALFGAVSQRRKTIIHAMQQPL